MFPVVPPETNMSFAKDALQAILEISKSPMIALPASDERLFPEAPFGELMRACRNASNEERNDVLRTLAPAIAAGPDSYQASRLAMLCGILVEWGGDPAIAVGAILERLTTQLTAAEPSIDVQWRGLRYTALAAMTMLCLDVNLRQTARRMPTLLAGIDRLAPQQREVNFLKRLLSFFDGEELVVLHPGERKGYRVRTEAIASNFHLFTLLQDALIGDPSSGRLPGHHASRMVLSTARGEIPHDRLVNDSAAFQYFTWQGLPLAGEDSPHVIPMLDGDRVLLLAPPLEYAPSWESTYFTNLHNALRSKVEIVEILSEGEVQLRLTKIARTEPRTQ